MEVKMEDENIVYQARLHWILFFWPALIFCINFYLGVKYPILHQASNLFSIILFAWFLMMWIMYRFSSLTIKKNRVILQKGILVRQTLDYPMSKIESIDIRQSIIGSLFGYGTLEITGTGGTRQIIDYIAHPLTCRRYIEQMMHT